MCVRACVGFILLTSFGISTPENIRVLLFGCYFFALSQRKKMCKEKYPAIFSSNLIFFKRYLLRDVNFLNTFILRCKIMHNFEKLVYSYIVRLYLINSTL